MKNVNIRLVIMVLVALNIGLPKAAAQIQNMPYPNIGSCRLETLNRIDLSRYSKTAEALSNFVNEIHKVTAAQTFNQLGFNPKQQVPNLTFAIENLGTTIQEELKNTKDEDFEIIGALQIENDILRLATECAQAAGAQSNVYDGARMEIDKKVSSNISKIFPRLEEISGIKFDIEALNKSNTIIEAIAGNANATRAIAQSNMSHIYNVAQERVKLANQQSSGEFTLHRQESNISTPFECIVKDRARAILRQSADMFAATPPRAIERELDGKVVLQLKLSSIGKVTDAKFIEVSDPIFQTERITTSAKAATYWPKILNCETSSDEVIMPIIFDMN